MLLEQNYVFDSRPPLAFLDPRFRGFGDIDLTEYASPAPAPSGGIDVPSGSSATQAAIGTGLTITSSAITSAAATGASLGSSSVWLAAAGGPIGLAVAGVTIALIALFSRKKPGQKRATTAIVNDVEPHLKANLQGYLNGPRTTASQQQALANFDAGWQYVVQNCETPQMGDPGKWCVEDRQPGGKWDWFALYRDPIANDATVSEGSGIPSPAEVFAGVPQVFSSIPSGAWLAAAAVTVALML